MDEPDRDELDREELLAAAVRLRGQGDPGQARLRLLELADRYPDDPEVAYQTAWTHDVLGREAEAVPFYERAVRGGGLSAEDRHGALLGLGSTYRVLGRYPEAVDTLRRAVAEFPDDGALRTFLAMALYNTGRHEEAMRLTLTLLAATSEDPGVRRYRRAIEEYARDLDATV
ncbi:tetratricopeptide repeat protein [Streptomyces lavenduligriseus]|uniref:Tetratricopeptide repeat protein n=1 Tax=Streptomyces lavenduligriseus TaxID=67315 RepID=A0ABT0NND4_9ACTN|nr:tetratricopeptide repeat protein [Streptomyces lavenduligriseus]MCL3992958.1 tetratricopeptide repeat protein [Streptomyces lavenduligriseus]